MMRCFTASDTLTTHSQTTVLRSTASRLFCFVLGVTLRSANSPHPQISQNIQNTTHTHTPYAKQIYKHTAQHTITTSTCRAISSIHNANIWASGAFTLLIMYMVVLSLSVHCTDVLAIAHTTHTLYVLYLFRIRSHYFDLSSPSVSLRLCRL